MDRTPRAEALQSIIRIHIFSCDAQSRLDDQALMGPHSAEGLCFYALEAASRDS